MDTTHTLAEVADLREDATWQRYLATDVAAIEATCAEHGVALDDARCVAWKEAMRVELEAERAYEAERWDVLARMLGLKLTKKLVHKFATLGFGQQDLYRDPDIKPKAILEYGFAMEVVVQENLRPELLGWRLPIPVDHDVLTAALWIHFILHADWWNVKRITELHNAHERYDTFEEKDANYALLDALKAAEELYAGIVADELYTIRLKTAELEEECPASLHAKVGRAFCLLEEDVEKALDHIEGLPPEYKNDDWILYAYAQAWVRFGKPERAQDKLAYLAKYSDVMEVRSLAQALCEREGYDISFAEVPDSAPLVLEQEELTFDCFGGGGMNLKMRKGMRALQQRVQECEALKEAYDAASAATDACEAAVTGEQPA